MFFRCVLIPAETGQIARTGVGVRGDSSEFRSDGPEFARYLSLIDRLFCGEPASTRRLKSGGRLRRKIL
jgi:hypothetical protein